jgi:uncharacterized protein (DUF302 family)
MKYYFSKTLAVKYEDAITLITEALKNEGFGIVSEIKMHEKFMEKLGVKYKKYTILGACNPSFAYNALNIEEKIGTMLPCNILVIEQDNGMVEIAAIDPVASMQAIENSGLQDIAFFVSETLKKVIEVV